jgi:hypothetical protein
VAADTILTRNALSWAVLDLISLTVCCCDAYDFEGCSCVVMLVQNSSSNAAAVLP